jgi:ubiquinone biosynthesis protein UbiJ
MVLEEQRFLHEDLERLEQAIADRVTEEPKHVSNLEHISIVRLLTVPRYVTV